MLNFNSGASNIPHLCARSLFFEKFVPGVSSLPQLCATLPHLCGLANISTTFLPRILLFHIIGSEVSTLLQLSCGKVETPGTK